MQEFMNKAVIFGIDGGSLKLIEKWQDELPNLKKMMSEGVYGELESTFPPVTCPAWATMFTGKNPGKLGIYDFIRYQPDQAQKFRINNYLDYASSTLWEMLNAGGKKVGLLNVAMTFPPQEIDSFMVCGVGSPSTTSATESNITYPPGLKYALDDVVGNYEILPPVLLTIPGKEAEYIKAWNETLNKREKAARYLMGNMPWDLFVCVFFVLDLAQHYMWHHMDENHIRQGDERYRDAIKDLYIKTDGAIGRLMKEIPEGTNVLVTSDHGFGPMRGQFVVQRWLQHNNFLKFEGKTQPEVINSILCTVRNFLLAHLSLNTVRLVGRMLPKAIRKKLTPLGTRKDSISEVYQSIDWSRTKAFGVGEIGDIYINLKGREPQGIVEPGQEYETVRDEIIARLRQIADPETGQQIDIRIFKKEEVYQGQYFNSAPDILYRIPQYPQTSSISSESEEEWDEAPLTGHHVPEGIFFAWGPDIKQSGEKLPGLKIYDIAPTILHMFGFPIPGDMDGRVLTEIFKQESEPGQREPACREVDSEVARIKKRIKILKTRTGA